MSTLASYNLTLADYAKMEDPKGDIAAIVNMLVQTNDIWSYLPFIECNDGSSHETVIATGLPQGAWVRYNQARNSGKASTAQVRAQTGMIELPITVDKHLAEKRGMDKVAQVRTKQAMLAIEGLTQQATTALFYEDERTNPERITGLAPHYSTVNTATAASAENVIDCGGTGSDNMSLWILELGEGKISGLLPQGKRSGIQRDDRGVIEIPGAVGVDGSSMRAYREYLNWSLGLVVENWTCGVRLPNIDVSNLRANAGSQADLWNKIIEGIGHLPASSGGKRIVCGNRTARTWMRIQALSKSSGMTTFETVMGKPVMMVDGMPFVTCDALLNTEARVV